MLFKNSPHRLITLLLALTRINSADGHHVNIPGGKGKTERGNASPEASNSLHRRLRQLLQ